MRTIKTVSHHVVTTLSDEDIISNIADASQQEHITCLNLMSAQSANCHPSLLAAEIKVAPLKTIFICPHICSPFVHYLFFVHHYVQLVRPLLYGTYQNNLGGDCSIAMSLH